MTLKDLLINVFEYNQHFVAMLNVINAARLNPPAKGHRHHIIPRCWFYTNNIPVDNSNDNLVLLTYEDHCKVHKLMLLCAKDAVIRTKLGWALKRLTNGTFLGCHHTEESKRKISEAHYGLPGTNKGKKFTAEHRQKLSIANKGKKHKPLSEETKRKLSEARKGRKMKPLSEETKRKISEAIKARNLYRKSQLVC